MSRRPSERLEGTFLIPSDIVRAERLQEELVELLREFEYDHRHIFAAEISLDEALKNAVTHGNGRDPSRKVLVEYSVSIDRFFVRIEDEGSGYEPSKNRDPTAVEHHGEPHGRGLLLMHHFMTEVRLIPPGNCVELVLHRQP